MVLILFTNDGGDGDDDGDNDDNDGVEGDDGDNRDDGDVHTRTWAVDTDAQLAVTQLCAGHTETQHSGR